MPYTARPMGPAPSSGIHKIRNYTWSHSSVHPNPKPWTSVSFTLSYTLVFIHICPLATFLLFPLAHLFLSSPLTLLFIKSCFLSFTQFFFSPLFLYSFHCFFPSIGSYSVLAISSSIDSFLLYSSDSSLFFLFADSTFFCPPVQPYK